VTSAKIETDPTIEAEVHRNLDLMHGFVQAMLDDPENMEVVPDGARIVLLPSDDRQWFDNNVAMGVNLIRKGFNVYFRHVDSSGRPLPNSGTDTTKVPSDPQ
jgi:hypothetical protein